MARPRSIVHGARAAASAATAPSPPIQAVCVGVTEAGPFSYTYQLVDRARADFIFDADPIDKTLCDRLLHAGVRAVLHTHGRCLWPGLARAVDDSTVSTLPRAQRSFVCDVYAALLVHATDFRIAAPPGKAVLWMFKRHPPAPARQPVARRSDVQPQSFLSLAVPRELLLHALEPCMHMQLLHVLRMTRVHAIAVDRVLLVWVPTCTMVAMEIRPDEDVMAEVMPHMVVDDAEAMHECMVTLRRFLAYVRGEAHSAVDAEHVALHCCRAPGAYGLDSHAVAATIQRSIVTAVHQRAPLTLAQVARHATSVVC